MHIKITRTELLKAINITEKAIQSHVVIESLKGVKIKAVDNKIVFTAQKDELSIEYTLEENLEVIKEGEIILPISYFSIIVKKTLEEDFEILNEDNVIYLKTKKSKINLTGYDISTYPGVSFDMDVQSILIPTNLFKEGFDKTKYCASVDGVKPILKGIHFKFLDNVLTIESADTKRLSIMKYDVTSSSDQEFTISKNLYADITKILEIIKSKNISLRSNGNQLVIEDEGIIIKTRLLDGAFPILDRVLPTQNRFSFDLKVNEVKLILEKIESLSSGEKGTVTLSIENEQLLLKSSFKSLGSIEEKVNLMGLTGSPFEISFDPKFLIEAIQSIDNETIYLQFVNELSGFLVKAKEGENVVHVISPVRVA